MGLRLQVHSFDPVATAIVARIDQLFTIDAEARRQRLSLEARDALRQEQSRPLLDGIRKQIEAARVSIARNMKRHGKMWIRVFPQKSFTKKPLETRMGKGKGPLESWVAVIRPANVLFEVDGVTEAVARESLRLAATKLPIKTRFISRRH